MHGRPRQPWPEVPEDPQKLEARRKKLEQFKQLTAVALANKEAKKFDAESLAQSALLLKKNPDVHTVWNYRREALGSLLEGSEGRDKAREIAAQELKVTEEALKENHKSYTAWYQRLWIIQKGLLSLDNELEQVNRILEIDSRNFHAWKYRREIVKLAGTDIEDELAYSRRLIDRDFSNYSAWHARSALLTSKYTTDQVISLEDLMNGNSRGAPKARIPLDALDEEFELVKSAFFTDMEDQSAYFYHRWLVKALMEHAKQDNAENQSALQAVMDRLISEEKGCEELLDDEPDRKLCKWPLQSLAHILQQQKSLGSTDLERRIQNLYKELIEVDPYRSGYYRDQMVKQ